MTGKEIIDYAIGHHLEAKMVTMMLFNKVGFSFSPINGPHLSIRGCGCSILDVDDYNVMSGSEYQLPAFNIESLKTDVPAIQKMIDKPGYLYGYITQYQNRVFGEILSIKGGNWVSQIRNAAFEEFIEASKINSIDDFDRYAAESEDLANTSFAELCRNPSMCPTYKQFISKAKLLWDDKLRKSISILGIESAEPLFQLGINLANIQLGSDKYISRDTILYDEDTGIPTISFSQEYIPLPILHTDIECDMAIVNKNDTIPDILYRIAIDIGANELFIATGYLFDSGLDMLYPTLYAIIQRGGHTDLLIGDMQHYDVGKNRNQLIEKLQT